MGKEELKTAIQNYYSKKPSRTTPCPPETREAIMAYIAERVQSGIGTINACSEIGFPSGNYYNWKRQGPKIKAYTPTMEKAPLGSSATFKETMNNGIESLEIIVRHPILGLITLTGAHAVKFFNAGTRG